MREREKENRLGAARIEHSGWRKSLTEGKDNQLDDQANMNVRDTSQVGNILS